MTVKFEILVLLRHYWKRKFSAAETTRLVQEFEEEDDLSERTVRRWFQKFETGDLSLDRKAGSGRKSSFDEEALRDSVEADPMQSTRELARELGVSQSTINRGLHKLGKVNRSFRAVPHELTAEQARRRVEICERLLKNPNDHRFIKRIVTCDEKWVYWRNPKTKKQWLDPNQPALPVAKQGQFEKKTMLSVFWNYEGIIHYEFIPEGQTIDSELYSDQLQRMYDALTQRYPGLVNRKQVLFQQDNARPHTSRYTRQKLTELDGIELLPHPAYSPDLAPSDYHLFRSMAHYLQGKIFNSLDDVKNGVSEFFQSKPKEWYHQGIQQLASRWQQTIDHKGIYFEY